MTSASWEQLRWLRPFASTKARALILLLTRVATAQCDLCVVAVIFDEEPLSVSKIVGVRHRIVPLICAVLRAAIVSPNHHRVKSFLTRPARVLCWRPQDESSR